MAIDGVSGRTSYIGSGILNLRSQLETLTEQLATGRKSTTYADLGAGRSLTIGIRAQLSNYQAYADTAVNVNTRINVANLALERLNAINSTVKGAAVSAGSTLDNTGQTAGQKTALLNFYDTVDMLNAQSGDRYLFGGRSTDNPPVEAADKLLNGDGAGVAGLKQLINERREADVGAAPNWGRVIISTPASATAVQIGEDFAANPYAVPPVGPSPFGLKLSAIATTITGAVITQPTETPPTVPPAAPNPEAMSIDLVGGNPTDGQNVSFTFDLPDGTRETITLTASTATPVPVNGFAIDQGDPLAVPPVAPDPVKTATNMKAALTEAVKQLANGPLAAASAIQAGADLFSQPPLRVAGTAPFTAATAQVAGTANDTVIWYTGENPTSPGDTARGSAVAKIDDNITVQYGARANEQALRTLLQNVAVFAAVTTNITDVNASGKIAGLNQRLAQNLAVIPGTQTIQNIQADFAGAQASIKTTTDRQTQSKSISQTLLDSIEGINNDEVATKILALQTALQASYQTTSQLYQMSLVKFL